MPNLVDAYYKKIDQTLNIYDDKRKSGLSITPHEKLHELFLKRLHNHRLEFNPMLIPGCGPIKIEPLDCFDLNQTVNSDSYTTKHVSTGGCDVFIDWYHPTICLTSDEICDGESIRKIYSFKIVGVESIDKLDSTIRLIIHSDGMVDGGSVTNTGDYVQHDRIALGAVVLEGLDDILPERPVKLTEVSKVTGVSASTLSEIRHGKTLISNLTVSTAYLLTRYGELRFLDRYCIDALSLTSDKTATGKTLVLEYLDGDMECMNYYPNDDNEYPILDRDFDNLDYAMTSRAAVKFPTNTSHPLIIPTDKIKKVYVEKLI